MQTSSPINHRSGNPVGETVPKMKGLQLNPRLAGAEPGSPGAATDGAGQPRGRGQREGPLSLWGHCRDEVPEDGSGVCASRRAPVEPMPLPGPGEAPLSPHLGSREEVWAASREPKAGARSGCGPRRQSAGCFLSSPDGRERCETHSSQEGN